MKCFVTGGAGFIGSHLTDRLILEGNEVVVYDNLSLGKENYISHHFSHPQFKFVQADLLDDQELVKAMAGSDAKESIRPPTL